MIVFEGVHIQTNLRPNIAKDEPNYPWIYAKKSGWMDSGTFYERFEEWEEKHGATTTKVNWNQGSSSMTGTFHMFGKVQSSLPVIKRYP